MRVLSKPAPTSRNWAGPTYDWSVGAWWRKVDAGFSVGRFDRGQEIREHGAEVLGQFAPNVNIRGRYSRAERGTDALIQAQVTGEWRINDHNRLSAELRRVEEQRLLSEAAGLLAALQYTHRFGSSLDIYGTAQFTVDDDDGRYADNDALTLGAKYLFGDLSSIGAEVTSGDRGDAAQINGEYRISSEHTVYGRYTYSTDKTDYDPLFNDRLNSGWTLGQRWRLSNQVNLFNESQFLKAPNESGLAHTFGMDFYPGVGWTLGFTLQNAKLDREVGNVDRRAISISGGRSSNDTQWQSKLEWRDDSGAEAAHAVGHDQQLHAQAQRQLADRGALQLLEDHRRPAGHRRREVHRRQLRFRLPPVRFRPVGAARSLYLPVRRLGVAAGRPERGQVRSAQPGALARRHLPPQHASGNSPASCCAAKARCVLAA